MLESEVANRIRTIFLQQRPHVSIAEATSLLGWTDDEMSAAIESGEVELERTPTAAWLWREELVAKALELWPLEQIADALGPDAAHFLPPALHLTDLHVRLPRYQVTILQQLADRDTTTISTVLTRELDDLVSAYAEEGAPIEHSRATPIKDGLAAEFT